MEILKAPEPNQTLLEPIPAQEKKGKFIFVLGTIFALFLISGAIVVGYLYLKQPSPKTSTTSPAPIAPTVTPTPTPTILKNEDITFEILNATKITGEAAKYGKKLEAKGYKIVSLGNIDGKYSGLSVFFSKELTPQKDPLLTDLKNEFPSASFSGELIDSNSLVKIIIGK